MKYRFALSMSVATVLALSGVSEATPLFSFDMNGVGSSGFVQVDYSESDLNKAKAKVDQMAQEGIGFLGTEELSLDQQKAEFSQLLSRYFDIPTIGRFALGRYWNTATAAQKKEYQKLFKSMIVDVYAKRFDSYNGQSLEILSVRNEGKYDALVKSQIVEPGGKTIAVDWRMRDKGKGFKVVDVLVEGVSMAVTQRSDFSSIIQRGGGEVEALLTKMRES